MLCGQLLNFQQKVKRSCRASAYPGTVKTTTAPEPEDRMPSRWSAALFSAKAWILRLRRILHDPHGRPARLPLRDTEPGLRIAGESRSLLYTSGPGPEFALQAGKVQNLRVAAGFLHGRVLKAGELFSFWAHVPRPTLRRGFAAGRELREGCIIPNVGGGLCQLTNALYDTALKAGCDIVERHAHTRRIPGSMAAEGRDATVFWNYVDLRFRPRIDCQLSVTLTGTELQVRLLALHPTGALPAAVAPLPAAAPAHGAESCETCGVTACFMNPLATGLAQESSTAWLVDAWNPEHGAWMTAHRKEGRDILLTPLDRRRWKAGPYHWDSAGFARVRSAPWLVLRRSIISRRLASQGAARQRALLRMDEALAKCYARRLPATALHVVVSQNILPFLWRSGMLAGRTFDVLMTRLPMSALQSQLDRAALRWPESPTLADFRADPALMDAESAALAAARHWITPHHAIAQLAGRRARLVPWTQPAAPPHNAGTRLIFPASTLSRKGARELREALRGTRHELTLCGPVVEGADFWQGVRTVTADPENWLAGAAAVVAPAWVEHQPRRLLAALAAGVPVIATPACGLPPGPGLTLVTEGDVPALRAAIEALFAPAPPASAPAPATLIPAG